MRWLAIFVTLSACGADEVVPADPSIPVVEVGDCDFPLDNAPGATADVLYAEQHGWFTNRAFNWFEVIRDDGPYEALKADLQVALPPVDFSTKIVVAVWESRETCDFEVTGAKAYSVGQAYHLDVDFDDLSGGCEETCEAPGGALVVISFPYVDDEPTVCRRTWDGCSR
jgi:hypothetical protein